MACLQIACWCCRGRPVTWRMLVSWQAPAPRRRCAGCRAACSGGCQGAGAGAGGRRRECMVRWFAPNWAWLVADSFLCSPARSFVKADGHTPGSIAVIHHPRWAAFCAGHASQLGWIVALLSACSHAPARRPALTGDNNPPCPVQRCHAGRRRRCAQQQLAGANPA
jgi:hypothetical protein